MLSPELRAYVSSLYKPRYRAHACRASSPDEVAAWQETARPALHSVIGLDVIAEQSAGHIPTVDLGETESRDGYTRTRCEIESEPGFRLPFWLLVPDGEGPYPIALTPHGHDKVGMDTSVGLATDDAHAEKIATEDRDVAVRAVKLGFLAIAPATRGQSLYGIPDVSNRHSNRDCRSQFMHAVLAGRTATGERVWDMMRLVDWASARGDTDATRVLVTGNSGGGVVTFYTAACDVRVSCAVPSCSYCSFVGESGLLHHCDCNAVPGIMRFGEAWDVAGLIAPRPLCIINGRQDKLFPLEEVDLAVDGVRRIYASADASDAFAFHYGPFGHRFYADLMWPFIQSALL